MSLRPATKKRLSEAAICAILPAIFAFVGVALWALAEFGGMSDDEVREASEACEADGGTPVKMAHLDGRIEEVRCW